MEVEFSALTVKAPMLYDFGVGNTILHQINGHFRANQLIGILGPSGAGKSTLLNVLSGYQEKRTEGDITINGDRSNLKMFRKVTSYIRQEDDLNGELTVDENVRFATDLKLGDALPEHQRRSKALEIVKRFGLDEVRDSKTKHISGGQRKRLAIILELISDPEILFLDEPTTGLDSSASQTCMDYLKLLTQQRKTVICTIHQPSSKIFNMFDVVYILSEGRCIYQGNPVQMIDHLAALEMPCNIYYDPADYIIEIANGDYGEERVDTLVTACDNGKLIIDTNEYQCDAAHMDRIKAKIMQRKRKSGWFEFRTLFLRENIKLYRNWSLCFLRVVGMLFNSVGVAIVFHNVADNAAKIFFNYNLVLAVLANIMFAETLLTFSDFPNEMRVLKNEYFNKYYKLFNYYIANTAAVLPLSIFSSVLASCAIYFLTGQPFEYFRIGVFLLICVQTALVAQSVGMLFGTIFPFIHGLIMICCVHCVFMVVSGFGILLHNIPVYMEPVSRSWYCRYALLGISTALYGFDRREFTCPPDEYCLLDIHAFLEMFGLLDNNFWLNSLALFIFYVFFRVCVFIAMRYRLKLPL